MTISINVTVTIAKYIAIIQCTWWSYTIDLWVAVPFQELCDEKKQFSWVSEFRSTVSGVDVAFLPQSLSRRPNQHEGQWRTMVLVNQVLGYWHQRAG